MHVFRNEELEFIETPGANATVGLATPSRGAEEVSVIRQRQQPGGGNPPHFHDREEVMTVIRGSVDVTIDGSRTTLRAEDTMVIPAQTVHQLSNSGESEAEWLLVGPAGIGFFHASGERGDPPFAR